MRLVLRTVAFLVIAGALALLGMALFSDLPAPQREVSQPVEAQ